MIKVLKAMAWYTWRKGYKILLLSFVMINLAFLLVSNTAKGDHFLDDPKLLQFFFIWWLGLIQGITSVQIFCDSPIGKKTSFPSIFYRLPVSTFSVVTCMTILALTSSLIFNYLMTKIWFHSFEDQLSVLGMAMLITTIFSGILMIAWSFPQLGFFKLIIFALVIFPIYFWSKAEFFGGDGIFELEHPWVKVTAWQAIIMAGIWVLFYLISFLGVRLDRQGDSLSTETIKSFYRTARNSLFRRRKPFPSAGAAQYWLECRNKGFILPAVISMFILLMTVMMIISPGRQSDSSILKMIVMFTLIAPGYAGFFVGIISSMTSVDLSKRLTIDIFSASSPLSDSEISKVYLKSSLFSVILTWIICLILQGGFILKLVVDGKSAAISDAYKSLYIWAFGDKIIPALFVSAVILVPIIAMLTASALINAGRITMMMKNTYFGEKLIAVVVLIFIIIPFLLGLISEGKEPWEKCINGGGAYWISGCLLVISVYCFRNALKEKLISRSLYLSFFISLVIIAACGIIFLSGLQTLIALSLGILIQTPFAAGPLSVLHSRHG